VKRSAEAMSWTLTDAVSTNHDRTAASNGVQHDQVLEGFGILAPYTIFRAIFGYFVLILVVRIVGRRPGKQLTPFEFVLIFFLGGLALTGIVGDEVSITNAICQILAIAFGHYVLVWIRGKSKRIARLLDGTPLILLEGGHWRTRTLQRMRVSHSDVMAVARDQGLKSFSDVDTAVLERNGEISIIQREKESEA
jgi:uncharacterized membrane protein YcaP (DUF421 family)